MDSDSEIALVFDKGEEENNKSDSEKDAEKKELFLHYEPSKVLVSDMAKTSENPYFIPKTSENNTKVALQPPETV